MAAPGENLRINPDRLWDSLMEMAKIGPGVAGGNNRQTLTDEDGEGRHLFQTLVRRRRARPWASTRWAPCSPAAKAPTPMRCRSMSAAISTPSRPAASLTACSACSVRWRSSAR